MNFDLDSINSGEFVYYTFPAEEQSKAISFSINDDVIPEQLESLRLATYMDGLWTSCSISDGCHRVAEIVIIDNDGAFWRHCVQSTFISIPHRFTSWF